jgi:hypothetical protein
LPATPGNACGHPRPKKTGALADARSAPPEITALRESIKTMLDLRIPERRGTIQFDRFNQNSD